MVSSRFSIDARPARHRSTPTGLGLSVGGGAMLGLASLFANHHVFSSTLGQMVTPWVLVAAAVGAFSRTGSMGGDGNGRMAAAACGSLSLVVASVAYNLGGTAITGRTSLYYLVLWSTVGSIVGAIAGYTGRQARVGPIGIRILAASGLAAVCLAEAVVLWNHIDHLDAHITYVMVGLAGLALPAVMLRGLETRLIIRATGLACVLLAPLAVVFEYSFSALGIV